MHQFLQCFNFALKRENVLSLKTRIDTLKEEKLELKKKLTDYRTKYDEKIVEFGCLQEENDELLKKNFELKNLYEKNLEV